MTEQDLNWSGKVPETRFMMLVKVGRSAVRHCLRNEIKIRERFRWVRDNFRHFIFRDQREKPEYGRSVLGRKWGEETVEKDCKAVCSLRILSKKKVVNICYSDWEEASEKRRGESLRSRIVLIELKRLRGFEEEEAIREALKCFLAAKISGVIFVWGSVKEFEVVRWGSEKLRWRRAVLRADKAGVYRLLIGLARIVWFWEEHVYR